MSTNKSIDHVSPPSTGQVDELPTDFYIAYPLDEAEEEHLRAVLACMRSEMDQTSQSGQATPTNRVSHTDLADEVEVDDIEAMCETEDAFTSAAAFALAERRAQQFQVSVTVYQRNDIGYDPEYGWIWEDQRVLAVIEPDGSGVYYLADDPDENDQDDNDQDDQDEGLDNDA